MSPSVAGRKRPRQRSVSFHALWWLVRREAVLHINVAPILGVWNAGPYARTQILTHWSYYERRARRILLH
jgi:hypothetical protein